MYVLTNALHEAIAEALAQEIPNPDDRARVPVRSAHGGRYIELYDHDMPLAHRIAEALKASSTEEQRIWARPTRRAHADAMIELKKLAQAEPGRQVA